MAAMSPSHAHDDIQVNEVPVSDHESQLQAVGDAGG
jgi:hypothetical protein